MDDENFNKSTICGTKASFYLKCLVGKGHNSKIIAFRVMPFVLQLLTCHDEQDVSNVPMKIYENMYYLWIKI